MTYEDRNAVYALNAYVRKLLEVNLGWTYPTYVKQNAQTVKATRIIPNAQQPELLATGQSFIVYGSTIQTPRHLYALTTETLAYTIWSPSSTEVNQISNLLFDVFKRQDDAVSDVNRWLVKEKAGTGKDRHLSFTSILPQMATKAEPPDEEGGYVSGLFIMDIQYAVDNSVVTTFGNDY